MYNLLVSFENACREKPSVIFLLALVINSVAFLLSHNYLDGDTHTRTLMAIKWLNSPFFVYTPNDVTWVFGPLHCYLNAAALTLWNDPPLVPRLLSLILTSLTIFPLYYSVKLEFGSRAAFYSAISCCFCTLFIHPAAIAASEGINLLLLFSALYYGLSYRNSGRWTELIFSAGFALASTMMRYDSWPLITMLAVLLLWDALRAKNVDVSRSRTTNVSKAVVFGFISHSFPIMWLLSQWLLFGHPLSMAVNSLDVPVINQSIQEMGRMSLTLYHLAFMPAIMLLCIPLPFAAAGLYGLIKSIKSRQYSVLFWLLTAFTVYYLVTFVLTLSRFPLARFITLPTIFLSCFSGVGIVYWLDKATESVKRRVIPIALAFAIVTPVGLSFFSKPSENWLAEKLRAVSPLTNPPDYYFETLTECERLLQEDSQLVLDTRNYNHRLLYIDLYDYNEQIKWKWPSGDSIESFVQQHQPELILRAKFPRLDKSIFDTPFDSDSAAVGGVPYRLAFSSGIYNIYSLDSRK